jgi:hypothetical protein
MAPSPAAAAPHFQVNTFVDTVRKVLCWEQGPRFEIRAGESPRSPPLAAHHSRFGASPGADARRVDDRRAIFGVRRLGCLYRLGDGMAPFSLGLVVRGHYPAVSIDPGHEGEPSPEPDPGEQSVSGHPLENGRDQAPIPDRLIWLSTPPSRSRLHISAHPRYFERVWAELWGARPAVGLRNRPGRRLRLGRDRRTRTRTSIRRSLEFVSAADPSGGTCGLAPTFQGRPAAQHDRERGVGCLANWHCVVT